MSTVLTITYNWRSFRTLRIPADAVDELTNLIEWISDAARAQLHNSVN